MRLIRARVRKGVDDPAVYQLARHISAGGWEVRPTKNGRKLCACVPFKGRWYLVAEPGYEPVLCQARAHRCVAERVWDFTVLNVRYGNDTRNRDTYADISTTLGNQEGDCDDHTIVICTLLESLGYETRARVISLDGQYWAHVYPVVLIDGDWVAMDTTENRKTFGWESPDAVVFRDFDMGV